MRTGAVMRATNALNIMLSRLIPPLIISDDNDNSGQSPFLQRIVLNRLCPCMFISLRLVSNPTNWWSWNVESVTKVPHLQRLARIDEVSQRLAENGTTDNSEQIYIIFPVLAPGTSLERIVSIAERPTPGVFLIFVSQRNFGKRLQTFGPGWKRRLGFIAKCSAGNP